MTSTRSAGLDPDLGLVVALADGPGEPVAERGLEPLAQLAIHRQTSVGTVGPIGRSCHSPRRSLTSCWSFIIP